MVVDLFGNILDDRFAKPLVRRHHRHLRQRGPFGRELAFVPGHGRGFTLTRARTPLQNPQVSPHPTAGRETPSV
jgi:hypothetical protein